MIASFKVKGSVVRLNGINISGVGNSLEVLVHAEVASTPGCRLPGKVSTFVKHKAFFKEADVEAVEKVCGGSFPKFYTFSQGPLQYEMENVEVALSKFECIAGVIPVEIAVSGDKKPTRKRLTTF